MFGFIKFKSARNHLTENRQVFILAALIVFAGFLSGAFYSNSISTENYTSYSEILKTYVNSSEKTLNSFASSSDIKNLLSIFFWSFFLFGKPFSGFFAFKSGFSIGFFISFFVKVYSLKGFFTGMAMLFIYVVFAAIPLILLTAWSFNVNSNITNSFFGTQKNNSKSILLPYIIIFLFTLFITLIGNYINILFIPKVMNILF